MISKHSEIDPVFSARIRILIFYPSWILDPGVNKAPDPGSATLQKTSSERMRVVQKLKYGKHYNYYSVNVLMGI